MEGTSAKETGKPAKVPDIVKAHDTRQRQLRLRLQNAFPRGEVPDCWTSTKEAHDKACDLLFSMFSLLVMPNIYLPHEVASAKACAAAAPAPPMAMADGGTTATASTYASSSSNPYRLPASFLQSLNRLPDLSALGMDSAKSNVVQFPGYLTGEAVDILSRGIGLVNRNQPEYVHVPCHTPAAARIPHRTAPHRTAPDRTGPDRTGPHWALPRLSGCV